MVQLVDFLFIVFNMLDLGLGFTKPVVEFKVTATCQTRRPYEAFNSRILDTRQLELLRLENSLIKRFSHSFRKSLAKGKRTD
jgi:hypothetical protein